MPDSHRYYNGGKGRSRPWGTTGGLGYDRDRCRQAGLIVSHPFPTSHRISTSGSYLISHFVCLLRRIRCPNKGTLHEQQQERSRSSNSAATEAALHG